MCLISVHGPGVADSPRALRLGAEVNYDGHGYAVAGDGGLWYGRGMDFDEVLSDFQAMRELHPGAHAMFHSRLSTGSAATEDNLHPVAVDEQTVVCHNGTLPYEPAWLDLTGDSDTRVFCEETFPAIFSDLDDEATFSMLEAWATPANKLVILTMNPRYAEQCYIVNRAQFIEADGVLYSNADFRGKGAGWDEQTDASGDLWRWNVPGRTRLRNETQRRAKVAAAGGKTGAAA